VAFHNGGMEGDMGSTLEEGTGIHSLVSFYLGGHYWLPTYSTGSNRVFCLASFLRFFSGPKLLG
jgi:hypothetical protein